MSVRAAVGKMAAPVDALILNAGGTGGKTPHALTQVGVTHIFAANVLGHVVLVDELLERQLITSTVLYAGSEVARGIPKMGVAKPDMRTSSTEEFVSIADGSKFGPKADPLDIYGPIKLTAAMWLGAMARPQPPHPFFTIRPGGAPGPLRPALRIKKGGYPRKTKMTALAVTTARVAPAAIAQELTIVS